MAMNREQKRMLQKQGELGEDGEVKAGTRRQAPQPRTKEERTKPRVFVREIRSEMRKVAWPTRAETVNYSIIVFITVVLLTTAIAGIDYGMSKAVLWIFK
jgi:preprotein translocase subunit SecE